IYQGKSIERNKFSGNTELHNPANTIIPAPSLTVLQDTFAVQLQLRRGWLVALLVLLLVVDFSIVGEIF
ncbi:hypothetical protein, partial [Vibrio parahaemolyticus]|uniref:hypothetical protein n=1 Tax=Vibrio parahaemolyticus TaxID=670 RepID=UPI002111D554